LQKDNVVLKAKHSRIFIDIERFEDDKLEEQYKYGMGWYYTKSPFENKEIRKTSSKKKIIKKYQEYHNKFTEIVEKELKQNNQVRIIDCHSFSNKQLWFQSKEIEKMPEICIGYEEYHKDEEFIKYFIEEFKDYKISINKPYSGSIVPLKFYKKEKMVKSTMIEINKKIYMNEETQEKKEKEYLKLQKHFENLNQKIRAK
jgi:N-formylglutamate amidohydrolase